MATPAATADVGVAVADRYPRISLSGLIGFNSNRGADVGSGSTAIASLGAAVNWSFLDFGRMRSGVDAAEARSARSLLVFEQAVLTALEETENALSGFSLGAQQVAQLEVATVSAEAAASTARQRYAAGSTDLLTLLDAERQVLGARDQFVQAQGSLAGNLVEVYRALGGGWSVDTDLSARR